MNKPIEGKMYMCTENIYKTGIDSEILVHKGAIGTFENLSNFHTNDSFFFTSNEKYLIFNNEFILFVDIEEYRNNLINKILQNDNNG